MPFGLQLWEVLLVLAAALLVFGPKRLPEMGSSLGRGLREFKDSVTGGNDSDDARAAELEPPRPVASDTRDHERVT